MRARDADAFFVAAGISDNHLAVLNDRQLQLTDLIALRQIRIEVVLAGEHRTTCHGSIDRQPEQRRHAHNFLVQHRQYTRVAKIYKVCLRVGLSTVSC